MLANGVRASGRQHAWAEGAELHWDPAVGLCSTSCGRRLLSKKLRLSSEGAAGRITNDDGIPHNADWTSRGRRTRLPMGSLAEVSFA